MNCTHIVTQITFESFTGNMKNHLGLINAINLAGMLALICTVRPTPAQNGGLHTLCLVPERAQHRGLPNTLPVRNSPVRKEEVVSSK